MSVTTNGTYIISFTDTTKGSFSVSPYTADGPATPTTTSLYNSQNARAIIASSTLTLVGKGVPDYGDVVQGNLLHMLENFCGTNEPTYPTEGQVWYDLNDKVLKVWRNTSWEFVVSAIASATAPTATTTNGAIVVGDLWYDTANNQLKVWDGSIWDSVASQYVLKAGDTMTGLLVLSGDPTTALGAVTKQYADNIDTTLTASIATKVNRSGDTMTGILTLSGDPVNNLDAATKQYVDTVAGGVVTVTGGTFATGTLTLHTSSGDIIINTFTASNIPFTPITGSITATDTQTAIEQLNSLKADINSPTFTGTVQLGTGATLTLDSDPVGPLEAATKQYVDTQTSLGVKNKRLVLTTTTTTTVVDTPYYEIGKNQINIFVNGVKQIGNTSGFAAVDASVGVTSTANTGLSAHSSTSGFQRVSFGGVINGTDATGLANDATTYTASVVIDGGTAQPISVTGSAAQTFNTLITTIAGQLTGATINIQGGNIVITSATTGSTSTVSITDTNLFSSLNNYVAIDTAIAGIDVALTAGYQTVNLGGTALGTDATGLANDTTIYTTYITVDGGTTQTIAIVGNTAQTITTLISGINGQLTGATAALTGGNIVVTSATTGLTSTINIIDAISNPLFSSLTAYVSIDTAVNGEANVTYTSSVTFDGGTAQPISLYGADIQTFNDLVTQLNTAITGGRAIYEDFSVVLVSSTTGSTSSVSITDTNLFQSLSSFAKFGTPSVGYDGDFYETPSTTIYSNSATFNYSINSGSVVESIVYGVNF